MRIGRRGFVGMLVGGWSLFAMPKAEAEDVEPTVHVASVYQTLADLPRYTCDGRRLKYYVEEAPQRWNDRSVWLWNVRSDLAVDGQHCDVLRLIYKKRVDAEFAVAVLNSPLGAKLYDKDSLKMLKRRFHLNARGVYGPGDEK